VHALKEPALDARTNLALAVPERFESYEDLLGFLCSRKATGMKLGLEHTRLMLERLGHPEALLSAVHVAGTNGKGSTSAMVESILRTAGYRTGLYTSPHLLDYRERILVGGHPAAQRELLEAAGILLPHLRDIPLSFFEITTLLAFLVFLARRVEMAVVEVGLGGRLDATNVLTGALPVITDIHFDHERVLGRRLAQIALEKAGIIRGPTPVVAGVRRRAVVDTIRSRCEVAGARLRLLSDEARWRVLDRSWRGTAFRLETPERTYEDLFVPLAGDHQVANAALSVRAVETACRESGLRVSALQLSEGLRGVRWPGRLQVVGEAPRVVLDAAHNPGGAKALATALARLFPGRERTLVVGMLGDKNHARVLGYLGPVMREVIATSPDNERGAPADTLAEVSRGLGLPTRVIPRVADAVAAGIAAAGREGVVCVAGSCYTVGEALEALGITEPFGECWTGGRDG